MFLHRSTIATFTLALGATLGFAQEKAAAAGAKSVTPPPSIFTWGGDARMRYEAYDGAQTLNCNAAFHIRDYYRFRARAWLSYTPVKDASLNVRIAAEPRYWYNNSTVAGEGKEWKYAIVDNLNAKWTGNVAGVPVTAVLGRQDIQLGDQWLVSDGTPLDGSWTTYFDGARVTLDFKDIKTKFDVIAFDEQAHPKDNLPILGRQGSYAVTEQDETGVILYASNKSIQDTQVDGYFLYKKDQKVTSSGNNGEAYTAGTRVAGILSPKWQYSAEAAYQWGRRDLQVRLLSPQTRSRHIDAKGAIAKLTYSFKDKFNNQVVFLGEYLSGDNADTPGTDEMFDVMWGRYPRVGETWAVAYATETSSRTSQYQNLSRIGATWTIAPTKNTSVTTSYFALFAPESTPTRTSSGSLFSRDGHFRAHMVQVVAKQKINKWLSALAFAEASFLGDYYTHHDRITFIRAELLATF
ncbi:MAG: hypothetical protein QM790_08555 [Nibricoccus sp.]